MLEADAPRQLERSGIVGHHLGPHADRADALDREAQESTADLGAEAPAPEIGRDTPADLGEPAASEDNEAVADRETACFLLGGEMEDMAALIALARHLTGDEVLDVGLAAQSQRNMALIRRLRHEVRKRLPVARLDLAQDQRGRFDRGKYGDNRHSAASYPIRAPSIQPSRKALNQAPSVWS